ncbi:Dabb family protein [uncultured Tateyamaria sp.]|uniref:Dabb family protein n=1 Tax=uncultured Tateyamaria sp. TaxID=455651 RepID=UPI0026191A29|nr:Dabb family protein [uncultured Tateyamaria sp.]
MIRHCVMLQLAADADRAVLDRVMLDLADLVERLEGCGGFCAGPNRDYEGKTPGFVYGFTFDADSPAALAAYAVHPDHVALGAELVALCVGGGAGIRVYDIEAPA